LASYSEKPIFTSLSIGSPFISVYPSLAVSILT
jgi:hypothetical protein